MTQGLFAAVSGIRANQSKLTVVSNNLANVNTTSYKANNVTFKTVFSDTIAGATPPSSSSGGTNPKQIGNGVTISDINRNFSQGGSLFTGRLTDLRIAGEGFFTVQTFDSDGNAGFRLTRAGDFSMDADGFLTNAGGQKILGTRTINGNDETVVDPILIPQALTIFKEQDGTTGDILQTWIGAENSTSATPAAGAGNTLLTQNVELVSFSFGVDGAVTGVYSNGDRITVQNDPSSQATASDPATLREIVHVAAEGFDFAQSQPAPGPGTSPNDGDLTLVDAATLVLDPEQLQIRLAAVRNPAGLESEGSNLWNVTANSGDIQFGVANNSSRGSIESGALESSNVDIAKEFTDMIIAQRGIEASSRVVTTQSQVLQTIIQMV